MCHQGALPSGAMASFLLGKATQATYARIYGVEPGVAGCSQPAHAGEGWCSSAAPILHASAQLDTAMRGAWRRIGSVDAHEMEMNILSCWCARALGLVIAQGFFGLHRFTSSWWCYASLHFDEKEQNYHSLYCVMIANWFEDATLENDRTFPFGCSHRWQVKAPLLLVLRFNGKCTVMLSSVKLIRNLRLGVSTFRCICQSDHRDSSWDTIDEHIL